MPHVLVADDSAVVRTALKKKLASIGATAILCASAAEANAVDAASFDLALLDLDLGDGSGVDVAVRFRARRPRLEVAFLSGVGDSAHRARAAAMGPVFSKPDGVDDAVAWVQHSAHA